MKKTGSAALLASLALSACSFSTTTTTTTASTSQPSSASPLATTTPTSGHSSPTRAPAKCAGPDLDVATNGHDSVGWWGSNANWCTPSGEPTIDMLKRTIQGQIKAGQRPECDIIAPDSLNSTMFSNWQNSTTSSAPKFKGTIAILGSC